MRTKSGAPKIGDLIEIRIKSDAPNIGDLIKFPRVKFGSKLYPFSWNQLVLIGLYWNILKRFHWKMNGIEKTKKSLGNSHSSKHSRTVLLLLPLSNREVPCHSVSEWIWIKSQDRSQRLPQGDRGSPRGSKKPCFKMAHIGTQ